MNLEESNEFVRNQNSKNRKRNIILALIIICVAIVIGLIITIYLLKVKDANTAKLYINNKKVKLTKSLFITKDDVEYVSVKELANYVGYNYIQGEYKKYTQDENYCYLQSNYEIVSIEVDSNKVKKYLINKPSENEQKNQVPQKTSVPTYVVKSENDTMEVFELESKVILENGNIYVPTEKMGKLFNIYKTVNGKEIYIYNINAMFLNAQSKAAKLRYQSISGIYENVRAICDGMVIVKDTSDKYGVISYADGKKILDMKYTDIQYIQNTGEFFVYTENSVGLLDKDGKTIIPPTKYDSLSVFDEFNKLYMVEKNGKFGILDIKGNILVPATYDKIGLKSIELFSKFEFKESETPNLLENKYIVVLENGKFGLYDLKGTRLIKAIYNSFGYVPNQEDKKMNLNSVLIIPKDYGINGLIIEQNGLYGIYDLELEDIGIPCSLTKIYSKTDSGETNYFVEIEEETVKVSDFLVDYDNGIVLEPEEPIEPEPEVNDPEEPEIENLEPEEPTEPDLEETPNYEEDDESENQEDEEISNENNEIDDTEENEELESENSEEESTDENSDYDQEDYSEESDEEQETE